MSGVAQAVDQGGWMPALGGATSCVRGFQPAVPAEAGIEDWTPALGGATESRASLRQVKPAVAVKCAELVQEIGLDSFFKRGGHT
jgi:hypothetical protein